MKKIIFIGVLALFLVVSAATAFAQATVPILVLISNKTPHPLSYSITGSETKQGKVAAGSDEQITMTEPVTAGEISEYDYSVHLAYAYERGANIDLKARVGLKTDYVSPYSVEAEGTVVSVDVPWWRVEEVTPSESEVPAFVINVYANE